MDARKKARTFIISSIIVFITFVILAITFYINDSHKTASLHIVVAPSFAKVTIDDKKYSTDGTFRFEPTTAHVQISADGFTPQEITITLTANETTTLALYLTPEDGDMSWYADHPTEDMILTEIGSLTAQNTADKYFQEYPISTILPIIYVGVDPTTYDWTEYRIDGGQFDNCKTDFCVKITDTTGGNRENALNKIRESGFNPNDYQVLYEYTPIQPL